MPAGPHTACGCDAGCYLQGDGMKKLLLVLAMWLAMVGAALAQININTATKEQLDGLKGIGPTKAQAIIDYRTKNGPFKTVDDLEKVTGIGPATMKDIRSQISVTGGGAAPAKAAKGEKAADKAADKAAKKPEAKEPAKVDAKKDEKKADAKKTDKADKADKKVDAKKAEVKKDDKGDKAAKKDEPKKDEPKGDKK
jgi:competence protein ComEA